MDRSQVGVASTSRCVIHWCVATGQCTVASRSANVRRNVYALVGWKRIRQFGLTVEGLRAVRVVWEELPVYFVQEWLPANKMFNVVSDQLPDNKKYSKYFYQGNLSTATSFSTKKKRIKTNKVPSSDIS